MILFMAKVKKFGMVTMLAILIGVFHIMIFGNLLPHYFEGG